MENPCVTRRAVVAGGCGLVAATALTACAGYGMGGPAPSAVPNQAGGTNEAAGTAGGATVVTVTTAWSLLVGSAREVATTLYVPAVAGAV